MTDGEICSVCNGSGEGQYDGTRCPHCRGSGVEPCATDPENYDIPEDWGDVVQ